MGNMELLSDALVYIEEHLHEKICTEEIAEACFCSKSTLEKLFRCVTGFTVRDYLMRRRMAKAAREIAEQPEQNILTLALKYGYSSHESFTRAFKKIWNCKPSEYRERSYFNLFPKLTLRSEEGDEYIRMGRHVDISELYDLFVERKDCYFVCCDIKSMIPINEISLKAGDLAIIESMRRMDDVAGEEDVVFRIGGDEFVLLTNSTEETYAKDLQEKICSHNGEPITYNGRKIPLELYAGVVKMKGEHIQYNDLFCNLHKEIQESKE